MQTAAMLLVAIILYASFGMLFLGILAWRKRKTSHDPMLAVLLWTITWWGIAYSIECLWPGFESKYFWTRMKYLGIVLVPLAMLGFSTKYTDTTARLNHKKAWPLAIIPLLTLIGIWTDPWHHLFYTQASLNAAGQLVVRHGPIFWLHTVYSYGLLISATWLLARAILRAGSAYRRQHMMILFAALIPWFANVLHVTGSSPISFIDPTPVAFLVSGFLIYLAVFHFGLLEISPVARTVVVDHMADGMLVLDLDDQILDMNPALVTWLGQEFDHVIGRRLPEIFPTRIARQISNIALPTGQIEVEMGVDGRVHIFEIVASLITNKRGKPTARMLLIRDITERKRIELAEREQRELAEVFRDIASVLNSTVELETVLNLVLTNIGRVVPHDAAHVLLLDDDGQILHKRLMGYSPAEEDQVQRIAQWAAEQKSRRDEILRRGAVIIADARQSRHFGEMAVFNRLPAILDVPIRFQDRLVGMVTLARAVRGFYTQTHAARLKVFADQAAVAIENARLYGRVQHLTLTDELTQLFNYRGLLELGQREFDRARRFERTLSVLFFDVDHFRSFNNRYTHAVGNQVLQEVAGVVQSCLRAVDLAARFGGEEFVVLLTETDLETAVKVAERIRRSVAASEVRTSFGRLRITISVGVAELTEGVADFAALIEHANHAEHHAKQDGRNRVVTYPRDITKGRSSLDHTSDSWSI